ncbi:MAG: 50S ribosomal protein L10 [Planctomycetes bacterium]|jgi:large subunit ribosomal protein L10|nr:50S ribosomal protein L10 [Planctomycetota bacterium]
MAKTKVQKRDILNGLKDKISRSKSIVFASFNALGVKENEDLRVKLRKENSEYYVAKKTLLGMALKDSAISGLDVKSLDGKVAAVFSYQDEVAPAKIVFDFRKGKEDKIKFVGSILEGKFLSEVDTMALAQLPSKQELYAKLVGSLNSPISGFVNALAGNLKNLVYVLKAIEGKKS